MCRECHKKCLEHPENRREHQEKCLEPKDKFWLVCSELLSTLYWVGVAHLLTAGYHKSQGVNRVKCKHFRDASEATLLATAS